MNRRWTHHDDAVTADTQQALGRPSCRICSVEMELAAQPVDNLSLDSRRNTGSLFFGIEGRIATAVILQRKPSHQGPWRRSLKARAVLRNPDGFCLEVEDLKNKIGHIASRFFGNPSQTLCVIGVTGTNGKTSCSNARRL